MARESAQLSIAPKSSGSASDPLWYQDAIIYEVHVKAFKDSNGDGIGDFPGLLQKLDYIQDLGVTCIWLLPFFPSPLKDDGYDISDYLGVHPMYGTMDDFQSFLTAAHERELQVMIELVVNHTSDQHPWFQAARNAPAGSPERDFYVWSDSDQKYKDARIIFSDTEKSNWTWDSAAQTYYWHRFFSHQPDLNYDNPRVVEEVLKIMRYWLDLGVDALRVDAIPYLVEREGTSCENLPETHEVVKRLRREIDAEYSNRMILAEANQWPTDVRPYFGDGDEFHMAFHFPLMPRMYMALRQEDRLPITDIISQTPAIPDKCQWGLFLRNHDELTLEMVTSDERDYMYLAYSSDPRMRLNLGIRRRLAPLVDNNRRRVELLNSLLFSLPGTPILYYGDEIGMGDNIYLGDRNGVRTPMQWNGDRNAGFSTATPARLYSPVIMDPVWGYEAINVEAQQTDTSSLLNWMRNMIALRKLFRVFGRGTIEFLNPANRKVLAYLRRYDGEQVLCVANLSRFAQPVDLDLAELEGATPIEMLGYVEFPTIERQPYRLTLAPYGLLWLEIHAPEVEVRGPELERTLSVADGWDQVLTGSTARRLETQIFPDYLRKQRWFAGKSREISATRIVDWTTLPESDTALALTEIRYESGEPETYLLLLATTLGEGAESLSRMAPSAVLCSVVSGDQDGVLHDGILNDGACAELLAIIENAREIPMRNGVLRGVPSTALPAIRGAAEASLPVRRGSAEQSNTSVFYDERLILKLFRHQQAGPNPDCEMGEYLTEKAHFEPVPPFGGSIEYLPSEGGGPTVTLAMLQGFVPNEGDGWKWSVYEVERYYETVAPIPFPDALRAELGHLFDLSERPAEDATLDHIGIYLNSAGQLGRRTAELHRALAVATDDPAFAPEPLTVTDLQTLLGDLRQQASTVFDVLKHSMARLPDEVVELAAMVLSRRQKILDHFRAKPDGAFRAQRLRIHGDYHLGQVLRVMTNFVILDFEGEPARPLAERRAKQSPLKDVAGMLRSFSYAAYSTLINYTARRPEDLDRLEPWAQLWDKSVSAEFLRAYRETAQDAGFLPVAREDFAKLLDAYLFDKSLYELLYELNNRPQWVRIPLMGILSLPI
jgi:maltose alpha-D-glucosyltransferase/alpha-amylase